MKLSVALYKGRGTKNHELGKAILSNDELKIVFSQMQEVVKKVKSLNCIFLSLKKHHE